MHPKEKALADALNARARSESIDALEAPRQEPRGGVAGGKPAEDGKQKTPGLRQELGKDGGSPPSRYFDETDVKPSSPVCPRAQFAAHPLSTVPSQSAAVHDHRPTDTS